MNKAVILVLTNIETNLECHLLACGTFLYYDVDRLKTLLNLDSSNGQDQEHDPIHGLIPKEGHSLEINHQYDSYFITYKIKL